MNSLALVAVFTVYYLKGALVCSSGFFIIKRDIAYMSAENSRARSRHLGMWGL